MSPKPVTAFRQLPLEDMAVRHFGEKSKHDYLRHIDQFLAFLGRPPETATVEDLRDFQVHLNQNGVRPASFNSAVSALRFFFCTTLGEPELGHQLARVNYPRKLPRVLSAEALGWEQDHWASRQDHAARRGARRCQVHTYPRRLQLDPAAKAVCGLAKKGKGRADNCEAERTIKTSAKEYGCVRTAFSATC